MNTTTLLQKDKFHIACYAPEIALNLGNIMRSAACFGMDLHIIEPCGFPFSPKAVRRSAMDYADHVVLHHHMDWGGFEKSFEGRKILLTTKSNLPYYSFPFEFGDALILGQESAGVPNEVSEACEYAITIPMPGNGRSLNVATAMAIVASDMLRQNSVKNLTG